MTTTPTMDARITGGTIGLAQGSALYVAAVLGTGILVLPGLAAEAAGPGSIVAVGAVLLLSIPLAGTFASLAARHPDSGGVATFVRIALGQTPARMAGYWFFFGVCVGTPVVAVLGSSYVVSIVGGDETAVVIGAILLLIPPFVSNAFGVRVSGRVQLVLSGLLVVVVVGVVAVTAPDADASNLAPFLPRGWAGVGTAISLFVWAFAGWEAVTHIAGEFRSPRRTIPRATGIAVAVVGLAYLALQSITVLVLGDRQLSTVPLLDLVSTSLVSTSAGGAARVIVASIAAVVALGVLNAYLGAFAKLGASLGRDGDLPRWLASGAGDGEIPRRGLAVVGVLVAIYLAALAITGLDLTPFILIHTSCMVAVYALGMVAAVKLLDRYSAGWWMAAVSCVLVGGLLLLAGPNLLIPAALAVAAVMVDATRSLRQRGRATAHRSPQPVQPPETGMP